jgi:choice-of-anchor C domain-containing protein
VFSAIRVCAIIGLTGALTAAMLAPQTVSAATANSNLIVNGSFEEPSIWQTNPFVEYDAGSTAMPGWTVGGNSIDLVGQNYWQAENGDQSVDLSGSAPGSVSQTVGTTPGANYTLSWYMAGNTNCGQTIKTMNVFWDGTLIDSPTFNTAGHSNTSMGWVQHQLNVTAAGASSAVEFADATPDMSPCGATLDNVSLTPAATGPPSFTEDSPPLTTLAGAPYSAIFFATGAPAYSLAGAPSWLSITPFGAVTGTPPPGTSSFSYSVVASNADGHAQAGPFTVPVQAATTVSGSVTDGGIAADPVVGAAVQACVTGGGECQQTLTTSGGAYNVSAPVGASVVLTAFPLPGTADVATSTTALAVPSTGITNETIALDGIAPLTGGLQVNGSSAPTVYWANPSTATQNGCVEGFGGVSVVGQNTITGQWDYNITPLTENPAGSGSYSGVIPPQEPVHGPVEISSTITCPPQSALVPNTGTAAGGTTVILSGAGFTGATRVKFGTASAASFTVISDETIKAIAPPGTGTVPVTVTVGTSSISVGQYTYVGITSVSPASGPAAGGTPVVITGTGLGSAVGVLFGTTGAIFTQVSDTQIDAISPKGSGTQNITVITTFGGTTPVATADQFRYSQGGTTTTSLIRPAMPDVTSAAKVASSAGHAAQRDASVSSVVQQVLNYMYAHDYPFIGTPLRALVDTVTAAMQPNCKNGERAATAVIVAGAAPRLAVVTADGGAEVAALMPTLFSGEALAIATAVAPWVAGAIVAAFFALMVRAAVQAAFGVCGDVNPTALVDPSGTVVDTNGNPVGGATVTILRAVTSAGPYAPVGVTSSGIDPATNPETTASDGVFHWDVDSGWYEVQASAPGCTSPDDPSQSSVTIGPYPVPPPQLGLTITLACANEPTAPVPSVTSLSQATGPPSGGTTVTVLGSGYTSASQVTFGATKAQSVTYLSPQALAVTSPPGTGAVDVQVQTAGGTSAKSAADQFFYGTPPSVTRIFPHFGLSCGGALVKITGASLTGATAVFFGGKSAKRFIVKSGTKIVAIAPPHPAGTVDVTVVNPAGASALISADRFTYQRGRWVVAGPAERPRRICTH